MIMSANSTPARPLTLRSSIARDLMQRKPFAFHKDISILEAAAALSQRQLEDAPVMDDDGRLLGVVSVAACAAWMEFSARSSTWNAPRVKSDKAPVTEIINPNVPYAFERTPSRRIVDWFVQHPSSRIYIVDVRGKLVGVLSTADILRRLGSNSRLLNR